MDYGEPSDVTKARQDAQNITHGEFVACRGVALGDRGCLGACPKRVERPADRRRCIDVLGRDRVDRNLCLRPGDPRHGPRGLRCLLWSFLFFLSHGAGDRCLATSSPTLKTRAWWAIPCTKPTSATVRSGTATTGPTKRILSSTPRPCSASRVHSASGRGRGPVCHACLCAHRGSPPWESSSPATLPARLFVLPAFAPVAATRRGSEMVLPLCPPAARR
jgi:hypothetical protein